MSDFEASTTQVTIDDITSNCLNIDNGDEYYKLNFNHKEDLYEINFYELSSTGALENDYSFDNRSFKNSFSYSMLQDDCYFVCNVPEAIPNLLISFVAKNGSVYEYVVSYNGRDGGADLINIEDLMSESNEEIIEDESTETTIENTIEEVENTTEETENVIEENTENVEETKVSE
jgi:hypothetical protein